MRLGLGSQVSSRKKAIGAMNNLFLGDMLGQYLSQPEASSESEDNEEVEYLETQHQPSRDTNEGRKRAADPVVSPERPGTKKKGSPAEDQ